MVGVQSTTYFLLTSISQLILISVPVLLLLGWFLLKNNKVLRKRLVVTLVAIFLVFLVFGDITGMFWSSRIAGVFSGITYLRRSLFQEVPLDIKQKSDEHIANIIGQSNFDNKISYIPGKSYESGGNRYFVSYRFEPYEKYGNFPIEATVTNGYVDLLDNTVQLPNCSLHPDDCEFNLSGEVYRKLIKQYGADDSIYIKPPFIYAELCPEKKYLRINYFTNEVNQSIYNLPQNRGLIQFGPCPVIYH